MKFIKILVPIALIAAAVLWGGLQLKSNKEVIDTQAQQIETIIQNIPVQTVKVTLDTLSDHLSVTGTFEPRKSLNVIAEMQGIITQLNVQEGQNIKKGTIIARIDDSAIQAKIRNAQAALDKAKKDVQRYQNLLDVGAISQTQFEEVELRYKNQEANMATLSQQLDYSVVRSPINGTIQELKLEQGSFASPGAPIATIVDINQLKMVVNLDEKDVVKVTQNQQVEMTTDVYPGVKFHGNIGQIAVQADEARKYKVTIDLKNNSAYPLKAGMFGQVELPVAERFVEVAPMIPRKSVVGSIKKPQVYVVDQDRAVLKSIELGNNKEDKVAVLNGLNVGDEIVVTGQINLENGKQIKIIQ